MINKFLCAATVIALFASCSKEDEGLPVKLEGREAVITLNVQSDDGAQFGGNLATRASGSAHGVDADDNTVSTLDVFVFNASDGKLDSYTNFTGLSASDLSSLEIKSKTGAKNIYVVANAHDTDWTGITDKAKFAAKTSSLSAENLKSFVMTGSCDKEVAATDNVSVTVSRLVGRVVLKSLKTNFAGTPYQGMALQDVKVYLTNVFSAKYYINGASPESVTVLNSGKYVASDCSATTIGGMLCDAFDSSVGDSGISAPHYFYCYENTLANEDDYKFTRLVIEGKLDGVTYYYPINVNRENFGWSSAVDHKGIKRNTSYALNIVINRPGTTAPDDVVEMAAVTVEIDVEGWNTVDEATINF